MIVHYHKWFVDATLPADDLRGMYSHPFYFYVNEIILFLNQSYYENK